MRVGGDTRLLPDLDLRAVAQRLSSVAGERVVVPALVAPRPAPLVPAPLVPAPLVPAPLVPAVDQVT